MPEVRKFFCCPWRPSFRYKNRMRMTVKNRTAVTNTWGMNFSKIIKKTGRNFTEITRVEKNEFGDDVPKLNAEPFLDIDTMLIIWLI